MMASITSTFPVTSTSTLGQNSNKQIRNKLIGIVALETLKEALISLAMTAVTCYFVATPAIPTLLIITVTVLAFNFFVRSLAAIGTYIRHLMEQSRSSEQNIYLMGKVIWLLELICGVNFSVISLSASTLVHESGHALAALAVYKNAKPTIEIIPLSGGSTTYFNGTLTKLGEKMGYEASQLTVTSSGPLFAVLLSCAEIGLGHKLRKTHPKLSLYLVVSSIVTVANQIFYALSALWQKAPASGHDFFLIWKMGGIHPVVSVITMIALPILTKIVLSSSDIF